ncbi:AraC family transcriptional regulator [Vallitalea pronyensis]|uniref:AraC family transcriptional regulator n=1 Tax=Vallitalea pronyensis TaxID=1348613 RepID=A0A8J8MIG5_9FIRM|nr:helix-turn-helix domain-containing protein [Vallitalea pronyensis]QUI22116.1 AraC family transcriptional regulator [Vallitalea pronyensis]
MKDIDVKHQVLLRFIIPYLLIFILSVFTYMIFYHSTLKMMEEEVVKNNKLSLEQISQIIDDDMTEIYDMAYRISNDSDIENLRFISKPFLHHNVIKLYGLSEKMKKYKIYNKLVLDFSIMYQENNAIITPTTIYKRETFFASYFDDITITYQQLMDEIALIKGRGFIPMGKVSIDGVQKDVLAFVHKISFHSRNNDAIVFLLDTAHIKNLFSSVDISDGGYIHVKDDRERLWIQLPSQDVNHAYHGNEHVTKDLDNKTGMIVTKVISENRGWEFIVAQPEKIVHSKVIHFRKIMMLALMIYLIVGMMFSFSVAYKRSKPLQNILDCIKSKQAPMHGAQSGNVYHTLEKYLDHIRQNNAALTKRLDNQIPLIRSAFFENILKGNSHSLEEINLVADYMDLNISGHYFAVSTFVMNTTQDVRMDKKVEALNLQQLLLEDLINKYIKGNKHIHQSETGRITVIHSYAGSEKDRFIHELREGFHHIKNSEYIAHRVYIGVGEVYDSLLHMSKSYEEANQAINYLEYSNQTILMFSSDIIRNNHVYYYPSDTDTKLIHYVASGDKESIKELVEGLYEENFIAKALSYEMIQLFVYNVYSSILKCAENMSILDNHVLTRIRSRVNHMHKHQRKADLYECEPVVRYYDELCDIVEARKNSRNESLIIAIKAYLEDNYTDAMLNLNKLSLTFNMSETYLSQYFKEHTGENYSDYLKKIRMQYAASQLLETDKNISQISDAIGYSSISAFSRAFRQYYGISASMYKKNACTCYSIENGGESNGY